MNWLPTGSRHRDVSGKVVVITGASGGVGRATAIQFARAGARVGLIARGQDALEEVRREIEDLGGSAATAVADVAHAGEVQKAADALAEALGPIDIWVNNAMATVFGRIVDLEPEEVRRVTEVTYLGYVHGVMAALRHMRPRGRGTIIQVGSALAYRGIPLQAAYCGAKHAIQGFTDSLRTELLHEGSAIRVATVHLPAMNTPQFDWARTKQERKPRPVAPVFEPQAAARAIVHVARHPAREYWLGGPTIQTIIGSLALPSFMDWFLARNTVEGQARDEGVGPGRRDNLYSTVPGLHRTDGSFGDEAKSGPLLVNGERVIIGIAALALAGAGLIGAAVGRAMADRNRRNW